MCSCILAGVMGTLRGLGTSQWTMGHSRGTALSMAVLGHTQVHLDLHAQLSFHCSGLSQQLFERSPLKTMVVLIRQGPCLLKQSLIEDISCP